jgi:hypothetical protein
MICENCDHPVAAHGGQGCIVGSALKDESQHCECPFDSSGFRPGEYAPCRSAYRTYTDRLVACVHFAGHGGDHEGYYFPSDTKLSHWTNKEEPVAVFKHDECGAIISLADRDFRCDRIPGHEGHHDGRSRVGLFRHKWPQLTEVANPTRSKYQDAVGSARDSQVGGDHYRKFKIQPWDIWEEYGLDPWLAGVVKYVLRAGHKGSRLEDLKKARHYLDRAIEIEKGR